MFNDNVSNIAGRAKIKVIGVGGAGNNAVNRMLEAGIMCADYYVVNTDSQILALSPCENKIQIGGALTKGLGAGAEPDVGRMAAEESKDELTEAVRDTDLLFITAGMGGGTGTGAAPVIAKIARDMKILTVAVVTEPFAFEGKKRMENTVKGLENLKKYVDTLIVIPNDKIRTVVAKNTPMKEALRVADEILKQGIKGIAELIVNPALINLDFADVKTVLKDKGIAHLGVGVAKGDNRIIEAVRVAVNCPLLTTTIEGAKGVILNIVGGNDLTMDEVQTAATLVQSVVDYSANIIFGACIDSNINDEVEVTVIATGFRATEQTDAVRNAFMAPPQPEPEPVQPAADPYAAFAQQPQQPVSDPYSAPASPYMQQPVQHAQAPQPEQPVYQAQQPYGQSAQTYQSPLQQPQAPQQSMQQPQQPYGGYNAYGYAPQQPQQVQQPQYGAPQQPQQQQFHQQYAAPQPEQEPEEDAREKRLPPFVRRMLGKK